MRRALDRIPILWEAPLAVLSYLARRAVQFHVLAVGCGREYRRDPRAFCQWRVNSPERLSSPLAVLRVMMVGPRWNTAALCASAGPFRVDGPMRIRIGPMARSSGFWTLLLFRLPGVRRATHWSALTSHPDREWLDIDPEPGDYFLNARLYRSAPRVEFPAVEVGGREIVAPVEASRESNAYLAALARYSSSFYAALNYYALVVARRKGLIPESLARSLLVPVGDPATRFLYGAIGRGEALRLALDPALLETHAVHATIYDRASFPVVWYEVDRAGHVGPTSPVRGFYLVRSVRMKGRSSGEEGGPPIDVERVAAPLDCSTAGPSIS